MNTSLFRRSLFKLTFPEFPFESKAKDAYNVNSCVVRGIKWLREYFHTGKEAKGLDNRYCVKFMQFEKGLFKGGITLLVIISFHRL